MNKNELKSLVKNIPSAKTVEVKLRDECFGGATISVKTLLSPEEMLVLVKSVVDTVIDIDTMEYNAALADCVTDMMILKFYANIPVDELKFDTAYSLVSATGIMSDVRGAINREQLNNIHDSIWEQIEYTRKLISSAAFIKIDELIQTIRVMIETGKENAELAEAPDLKAAIARLTNAVDERAAIEEAAVAKKQEGNAAEAGQLVQFPSDIVEEATKAVADAAQKPARKRKKSGEGKSQDKEAE